ncbi:hypothetical protein PM082_021541 [Marasmius tenuissimus]|nr:hypothetical protein PM082_021541 [Marasmius tenuissimus]
MYKIGFNHTSDSGNTEHHSSNTVTSITSEFDSQLAFGATFRLLTIPSLTSLHLCGSNESLYEWPIWDGVAVADFLSRSSCSITSLCLKNLPITADQTITLLEHIPTLVSLEIEERRRPDSEEDEDEELDAPESNSLAALIPNCIITRSFLQRLTVEHEVFHSSHPFLPLLTNITIAMREDDIAEKELFNAVASRWIPDPVQAKEIGVESLKSVTITFLEREGDSEERGLWKALECFRDAGLRLRVDT